MNKKQIKAELRRSAVEDDYPFARMDDDAWKELREWFILDDVDASSFFPQTRMFMLLVAEAL